MNIYKHHQQEIENEIREKLNLPPLILSQNLMETDTKVLIAGIFTVVAK